MKTVLVTGATGSLGKSVVTALLNKNAAIQLAVLVRDASKAEELKAKGVDVRVGNYDDPQSLVAAFKGIDTLYFVSGSDIVKRSLQHENVVKAAKEAGVKHVVYTSFMRKNETASSPIALVAEAHIKTEQWLKASGLTFTILKHNLYMDMLPMFMGEKVLETGIIYQPAGEGKTAFTLRDDMAEVAAHVLTSSGHENKEYDITAEDAYSYSDVAAILSQVTGKPIHYVSPSAEEFNKTLSDAGVPMEYIGLFASFSEAIKQGEFEKTSTTIAQLTGKKPTSLTEFLKTIYATN